MTDRTGRRPPCKARTVRYARDKETFRNRSREFLRCGHTLRLVDRVHRVHRPLHRTDNQTFCDPLTLNQPARALLIAITLAPVGMTALRHSSPSGRYALSSWT